MRLFAVRTLAFTWLFATTVSFAGAAVADTGAEDDAHGHHVPHFDEINWAQGFLGESEEEEPGLLWRRPGKPVPVGAMLLNTALLFWLLVRFGGPKISEALKARKHRITSGMQQAAAMREEAEERLREYEVKLEKVDEQIERAKQQILVVAKAERDQVLKEAKDKRDRMERDARLVIEQELKAVRETLHEEVVREAVQAARQVLAEQSTPADEHRLQDEYLTTIHHSNLTVRGEA
jgi:F-type H+-transporting ATPase subunit b